MTDIKFTEPKVVNPLWILVGGLHGVDIGDNGATCIVDTMIKFMESLVGMSTG